MLWFIYFDNSYVGTVIARDQDEALTRAEEKFGPIWGIVEARPRKA